MDNEPTPLIDNDKPIEVVTPDTYPDPEPEPAPAIPPTPPTTPTITTPTYPTLEQYAKLYDPEKNPHPWIKYVQAIPMGGDRPPMNHSLEVLNLIAIHLERLGFTEPDPANCEIKYIPPTAGPNVAYNPGTWVDINTPTPETEPATPQPDISLEGVPQAQLDILKRAITQEEIRKLRIANADPAAQAAAIVNSTERHVTEVVTESTNIPETIAKDIVDDIT